jgi:predicted CXXCH cytochrome family protein
MAAATPGAVLGDFGGARFAQAGIVSSFFRRGEAFLVRTDGPSGALEDHEVRFTFGVAPLQQYLIALPGGRLQALGIAWDARPAAQGGQRWFHLYPSAPVTHDDPLHWTRPLQSWNAMCADCHSTDIRRGHDPATGRYATTFAEIDVSCEACHGPGSAHVRWARGAGGARGDAGKGLAVLLDERRGVSWDIDPRTGNGRRSRPRVEAREIEACGRCHARRGELGAPPEPGAPLGQAYRLALLDEALYFPDGQIRDEVFEVGSFLQSRMFHAGVTCSDCHDPHGLSLRATASDVCLQCHAADRYRTRAHHHHAEGPAGVTCVGCHMPARPYMVVDVRHDHGFRIPRPDRTISLGTPNTCNGCHPDRPAAWAVDRVRAWYDAPKPGFQGFAEALHAGDLGAPGSRGQLLRLAADPEQPGIARASALTRVRGIPDAATRRALAALLGDADPLVRRAAAGAYAGAAIAARVDLLPLLEDPVRDVRLEAARRVAMLPREALGARDQARRDRAIEEYVAAQRSQSDRPEALSNLGALYLEIGRGAEAEAAFARALALDPTFAPAAVNLADLYRQAGRDPDGEAVLRRTLGTGSRPSLAIVHHALGLLLVRAGRGAEALRELARAAELGPDDPRLGYVLALALRHAGRDEEARRALVAVIERHPYHPESLRALVDVERDEGRPDDARRHAARLAELTSEEGR